MTTGLELWVGSPVRKQLMSAFFSLPESKSSKQFGSDGVVFMGPSVSLPESKQAWFCAYPIQASTAAMHSLLQWPCYVQKMAFHTPFFSPNS